MLPCFESSRCKRKCSRPFCRSQFNPKRTSPRHASSISSLHRGLVQAALQTAPQLPSVRVKLGPEDVTCKEGRWKCEKGAKKSESRRSFTETKRNDSINRKLECENDLLRLKNDILFDMLVEAKAQLVLQENEIEQLKRCLY